jgi:hypothetical protein
LSKEAEKEACTIVGELMFRVAALDDQLNRICAMANGLRPTATIEALCASIDLPRKVEILRALAKKMNKPDWRDAIKRHADAVEKINRVRNIAAHSVLVFERGEAVLHSSALAKLLNRVNLPAKTYERVTVKSLVQACKDAQDCLANGDTVLLNLEQFVKLIEERKQAGAKRP